MKIKFKKHLIQAITPTKAQGDEKNAGYDLYATGYHRIAPFQRLLISTGLSIEIPEGFYGRIAPRSGLALKNGIDVMAGVVDATYRGVVGVILINLNGVNFLNNIKLGVNTPVMFNNDFFEVKEGDRIAQIIFEKCHSVTWEETNRLSETIRAEKGFGSNT